MMLSTPVPKACTHFRLAAREITASASPPSMGPKVISTSAEAIWGSTLLW